MLYYSTTYYMTILNYNFVFILNKMTKIVLAKMFSLKVNSYIKKFA